ncbi:hypothetical protein Hdeb2414_s0008g00275081 [Helianthus debilis subsp. tardiflorus]
MVTGDPQSSDVLVATAAGLRRWRGFELKRGPNDDQDSMGYKR